MNGMRCRSPRRSPVPENQELIGIAKERPDL